MRRELFNEEIVPFRKMLNIVYDQRHGGQIKEILLAFIAETFDIETSYVCDAYDRLVMRKLQSEFGGK